MPFEFEKKSRTGNPNQHRRKKIIGLLGGILLLYLPSLARLEVEEERIVVDKSGGDSLVQELGMPTSIKNKNKITNYSSLSVLLHKKNDIGSCFIHYPQH
jgi:hypothetical protein